MEGADAAFEFMLNALRLKEPVPLAMFQQRTGCTLASIREVVTRAEDDGLLEVRRGALSATDKGFRFLNELLERFLPSETASARSG